MRRILIAGLALALSAAAAQAQTTEPEECTGELADARRAEIVEIVKGDSAKNAKLGEYLAEADKKFSGMRADDDICNGLAWILEQLKGE